MIKQLHLSLTDRDHSLYDTLLQTLSLDQNVISTTMGTLLESVTGPPHRDLWGAPGGLRVGKMATA